MVAASRADECRAGRLFAEDGIEVHFCGNLSQLIQQVELGAAAVLINARIVSADYVRPLLRTLERQPTWSDLPVILVTAEERPGWLNRKPVANVTILRQPVHMETLLSVVRSAITSRLKQYEVRDLLEEQERTQAELRKVDRRKDEFLATLAHELRNPISPIQNALDLLELSQMSLQEETELREIMRRQVKQLTRLVDDLLDVSRITRGRIRLERQTIDLRDAVRAGIEASQPFIDQSDQTLEVDLGAQPLMVKGDATRLAQCVANLLNNAAKYTPAGGRVRVGAEATPGMVVLTVQDNGIGIAADQIDSVFELFRQHDTDRQRGQAGLGIGLTLVQRLLRLHAGTIEVHSDGLGQGSTFTVRLPVAVPCNSTTQDSPSPTSACPSRFRVLVVEDTPAIRTVLQRLLEAIGHEVIIAEDGVQGVEEAMAQKPQVVISDISMPRMNGLQLARRLRRHPAFNETPLIAMTGYGRAEDQAEALEAGFNHHLTKPVDIAELRRVFANLRVVETAVSTPASSDGSKP